MKRKLLSSLAAIAFMLSVGIIAPGQESFDGPGGEGPYAISAGKALCVVLATTEDEARGCLAVR